MGKVCVIGLDGGSPELIERWQDELPNLRRLMAEGAVATLRSTMPPYTLPAWNCLISGCNPGKVGIFGFVHRDGRGVHTTTFADQMVPSLWDAIGDAGKRVGVVNVPVAFPPCPVNGFFVSGGLLTPRFRGVGFTYPPELQPELTRAPAGYDLMPLVDLRVPGKEHHYLAEFRRHVERQTRGVVYLLRQYPWDFFMYVMFVTDPAQHYFWHHMDPTHPLHRREGERRYGGVIKEIYRRADDAIGRLLPLMPAGTTVFVVSDHGFGPLHGSFLVNEWLRQQGFLRWKAVPSVDRGRGRLQSRLRGLALQRLGPHAVRFLTRALPRRVIERLTVGGLDLTEEDSIMAAIDWSQTVAYGGLAGGGNVSLNLEGREPEGIVPRGEYDAVRERIAARLLELKDPDGRPAVRRVYRREELYHGPHADRAPDLLFTLGDGRYDQFNRFGGNVIWAPAYPRTGSHRGEGLFIAHGPQIKAARLAELQIIDVAPTLLHLLDVAVPRQMDGRVIRELFRAGAEAAGRPPVTAESSERQRVRERIRRLRAQDRL